MGGTRGGSDPSTDDLGGAVSGLCTMNRVGGTVIGLVLVDGGGWCGGLVRYAAVLPTCAMTSGCGRGRKAGGTPRRFRRFGELVVREKGVRVWTLGCPISYVHKRARGVVGE